MLTPKELGNMARRYEISDDQRNRIKQLFPITTTGRPLKWNNKTMFNAIIWIVHSDSTLEDIPGRYPPH